MHRQNRSLFILPRKVMTRQICSHPPLWIFSGPRGEAAAGCGRDPLRSSTRTMTAAQKKEIPMPNKTKVIRFNWKERRLAPGLRAGIVVLLPGSWEGRVDRKGQEVLKWRWCYWRENYNIIYLDRNDVTCSYCELASPSCCLVHGREGWMKRGRRKIKTI